MWIQYYLHKKLALVSLEWRSLNIRESQKGLEKYDLLEYLRYIMISR